MVNTIYVVKVLGKQVDEELLVTGDFLVALDCYHATKVNPPANVDMVYLLSYGVDDNGTRIEGTLEWIHIHTMF